MNPVSSRIISSDLSPDVSIILDVDADHLEYFKNIENIIKSFHKFATMASKAVIYNGDERKYSESR